MRDSAQPPDTRARLRLARVVVVSSVKRQDARRFATTERQAQADPERTCGCSEEEGIRGVSVPRSALTRRKDDAHAREVWNEVTIAPGSMRQPDAERSGARLRSPFRDS